MSRKRELSPWQIFALVFLGCVLLALVNYAWRYYLAAATGKANAEWKIEGEDSRISNYNHFFDLCATVQGYEGAIEAQELALKEATTSEDQNRIKAVITSVRAQRTRAVAQYNADARKEYTKTSFKDAGLPSQLNDGNEVGTTCAN